MRIEQPVVRRTNHACERDHCQDEHRRPQPQRAAALRAAKNSEEAGCEHEQHLHDGRTFVAGRPLGDGGLDAAPATESWRIAWTNPVRGHHEEQIGRWNGPDILQEGSRPDGTKTRWTFTEITAHSFRWRGEALYPNASTWTLEAEFLATRR